MRSSTSSTAKPWCYCILNIWYLKFVHWIENGYSKEIKKTSSEKTMKFRRKVMYILLEKGLLEFFRFFIGLYISENYLRTTFTFGKLPYKFHVSHVYPIFGFIFLQKRTWIKRYCLGLSTSRINEFVGWKYMLQSSSVCTFNSQRVRTFCKWLFTKKVCSKLPSF